jgi:site-specific recombinase XerD
MSTPTLGSLVHSFFVDHLQVQKGLRLASIRSYRDAVRLFLDFIAREARRPITRLSPQDLTCERVQRFLQHLEQERHNHIRTRNHRLAALHTFFEYLAHRAPEMLGVCAQVAAIPVKRVAPPEAHFLDRDEVSALLRGVPPDDRHAARDRALLLFLYNTGARAQEVAELRVRDLDLNPPPRVRLHGKGDKWRVCPLWTETARQLQELLRQRDPPPSPEDPVFVSRPRRPLTRFGIYKIVRRHASRLATSARSSPNPSVSPHTFRHTAAVHLLESGVEINVVRGWLGHASLETTNRYAEITLRTKEAALRACEPAFDGPESAPRRVVWRDDETLLKWLESL